MSFAGKTISLLALVLRCSGAVATANDIRPSSLVDDINEMNGAERSGSKSPLREENYVVEKSSNMKRRRRGFVSISGSDRLNEISSVESFSSPTTLLVVPSVFRF